VELLKEISDFIYTINNTYGFLGVIIDCLLILIESIIPVLPLSVFITLIMLHCGKLLGFFISWCFTVIGCMLSYIIFNKLFQEKLPNKYKENIQINKLLKRMNNTSLPSLVLILAMPFTPAFAINIAAGIANIDYKKYFIAVVLGKIFLVYFWGYIGTSLVESLTNPTLLIEIAIVLSIIYVACIIIGKKLEIK